LVLVSAGLFAKTPFPIQQATTASQSNQSAFAIVAEPDPSKGPINSVVEPDAQATNGVISVYPNPASTFLDVKLSGSDDKAEISLYDVTGKLMKSVTEYASGEKAIRVSRDNLPSGVYFLVVKTSSMQQCREVIFS
jgi:hypothetical protein